MRVRVHKNIYIIIVKLKLFPRAPLTDKKLCEYGLWDAMVKTFRPWGLFAIGRSLFCHHGWLAWRLTGSYAPTFLTNIVSVNTKSAGLLSPFRRPARTYAITYEFLTCEEYRKIWNVVAFTELWDKTRDEKAFLHMSSRAFLLIERLRCFFFSITILV